MNSLHHTVDNSGITFENISHLGLHNCDEASFQIQFREENCAIVQYSAGLRRSNCAKKRVTQPRLNVAFLWSKH